jgi:ribosome production factor 2
VFPFEDTNSIEFLMVKNDCSLFALGSHSKKRPTNLILGRAYDGHILDVFEFGIDNYAAINAFKGSHKAVGSKPLIVFQGDQWGNDSTYSKLQYFLLDFFRGEKVEKISLKGLDHCIIISVIDGKIFFRVYSVDYRKSGTKVCVSHYVL